MSPDQTIRMLQQLFAASSASTQAYRRAAAATLAPGLATLFAENARDHARIASWVSRQIARVCRERHLETPSSLPATEQSQDLSSFPTRDQHAMLALCIELHDAVTDGFGKAKVSSLAPPLHRFIAREHEQLRWAREGLERIRRERSTHQPNGSVNVMEQLKLLQARSFDAEHFDGRVSAVG